MIDRSDRGREFAGKTALVTGAGDSIGRGIADRLIQQGASVFVTDYLASNRAAYIIGQALDIAGGREMH